MYLAKLQRMHFRLCIIKRFLGDIVTQKPPSFHTLHELDLRLKMHLLVTQNHQLDRHHDWISRGKRNSSWGVTKT